jgi:hypothetical protein
LVAVTMFMGKGITKLLFTNFHLIIKKRTVN